MIRSLWTASTGLNAQQVQIDIIANNLANVSTNGFKQARGIFADLLYQTLRQPGAQSSQTSQIPDGLQIGLGTTPVSTGRIFTQGSLQQTGNSLDMAIDGAGFFQVLLPDGTTAYTRDGSFQKDNQGQIVTANGYPLQPAITIPANALTITVGTYGVVARSRELSPLFLGARAATSVRIGSAELEVLVTGTPARAGATDLFTLAERDVADAVLRCMTDADIARARGTSVRTVANQMRRLFAKVGARSRGELRAKLLGP